MREIFIKYNPYKVETTVTIDGKPVKKSSMLNMDDRRLQEWIDELPESLLEECNTKSFHITFQGTILDYEDFQSVIADARENGFEITCEYIPAKEVKDKEKSIEEIFEEIQNGPFEELKAPDMVRAFRNAQTSDFPVNVIATMSAGKSTLINALLRQKLMPAKQEACTATITELKDSDATIFHAEAYDQGGNLIMAVPELTLSSMEALNADSAVSTIKAEGDIPFVSSEDVSLVLVDTPGPNNSRDPEHKAATYRMLSESSKTLVLYILNATQLAVNDDNNLLSHVADSMKVGGKQSRDRFLFVVNKLDDFKKGEDSVTAAIDKVRKYLEDKGIHNPNIYPASALTALDIRTVLREMKVVGYTEEELDELDPEVAGVISKVKKINKNGELHLEQYAPLTPSVRAEIASQTAEAEAMLESESSQERSDGMKQLALIHSGIIPIEAAIRMYVLKYAKTAKIKNIVDTFSKKLESASSFEKTRQEIASNQSKKEEILTQIGDIRTKLKSGEEAKKFKNEIDKISYDSEINKISTDVITSAQKRISGQISGTKGKKWKKAEAEDMIRTFGKFAEDLQANVQVQLEELITQHVQKNAQDLLEQYRKRLAELSDELAVGTVQINAFELMDGELPDINVAALISTATKKQRVKVGSHSVKNPDREGFLGFFKFWKPRYIEVDDYENQEYIDAGTLADKFFAPFQKELFTNQKSAVNYAKEQASGIKASFRQKFEELDELLAGKLRELEACASDEMNVDAILKQTRDRLGWLENIETRIQEILDI